MVTKIERCDWPRNDELYIDYHDFEWGRPTTDQFKLFEKICLEGFQSGLSWITILKKRERFREVFEGFDFYVVAEYDEFDLERLLTDTGIIRHRGKIEATINNAQKAREMVESGISFQDWIWEWAVKDAERTQDGGVPASTERSTELSKTLKKAGWRFVGPTTAYAFMQSEGLTNDHDSKCFVADECETERLAFLGNRTLR